MNPESSTQQVETLLEAFKRRTYSWTSEDVDRQSRIIFRTIVGFSLLALTGFIIVLIYKKLND
jgi:hypothetical protein